MLRSNSARRISIKRCRACCGRKAALAVAGRRLDGAWLRKPSACARFTATSRLSCVDTKPARSLSAMCRTGTVEAAYTTRPFCFSSCVNGGCENLADVKSSDAAVGHAHVHVHVIRPKVTRHPAERLVRRVPLVSTLPLSTRAAPISVARLVQSASLTAGCAAWPERLREAWATHPSAAWASPRRGRSRWPRAHC